MPKKVRASKCKTKYCRRKPTTRVDICNTCYSRAWRKAHPYRDAYHNLKSNAKRRGKSFDLTFEEFKTFAIEVQYLFGKGRKKNSYTIHRIDEEQGYSKTNIGMLTNSDNVKAYHRYIKLLQWRIDKRGVPDFDTFRFKLFNLPNWDELDVPF